MPALPPVAHIVAEPRWGAHPPKGMTLSRRRLRAVTRGGYSPWWDAAVTPQATIEPLELWPTPEIEMQWASPAAR
jgi:hypothetical protein